MNSVSPLLDRAAGHLEILAGQRAHHIDHRQLVAADLERIELHVDLPRLAADQFDLAHALGRLQPAAQRLVAILGDVAERRGRGNRHRDDRRGVGIHLLDGRLIGILGQIRQHAVHPVADFLRGHIDVLLQARRSHKPAKRLAPRSTAARRCR